MKFFDNTPQLLILELLEEVLIGDVLLDESVSSFRFGLLGPNASFSHLRLDFSIFIVIEMVAVDFVTSQLGKALPQVLDDDILAINQHIAKLDFIYFLLNHKRKSVTYILSDLPTSLFLKNSREVYPNFSSLPLAASTLGAVMDVRCKIFCLNPPFSLSGGPWKRTLSPERTPMQRPLSFLGYELMNSF